MPESGIINLNHADRVKGLVKRFRAVRLFPYDIQDISQFLRSSHPEYDPYSNKIKEYWRTETRRCFDGWWVNDNGTWIFMLPKLYFYINHGTITVTTETDEGIDREVTRPDLTHLEWIFQTAIICCQGFSGFAEDPDYTCNKIIRDLHLGKEHSKKRVDRALKYGKKSNGDLKLYIDPWEYLTRFYLLDEPRDRPLGAPIYANQAENLVAITTRNSHKTFNMAVDFVHEFLGNGAKSYKAYQKDRFIQMFTGASDTNFLDSFYDAAYSTYSAMAGGPDVHPHPMFRESNGKWDADKAGIEQKYRLKGQSEWQGTMTAVSKGIFKGEQSSFAAVSKRVTRAYVDEVGRVANARTVYGTFINVLKDGGLKFGSAMFTGTGGNITMTEDAEFMFKNPKLFEAIAIPNYWRNNALIGLFVSYADTLKEYTDENGNIDILGATEYAIKERKEFDEQDDSAKGAETLIDWIINQPLDPSEPFKISQVNVFDQARIAERIAVVEEHLWKEKAKVKRISLRRSEDGYQVVLEDRQDLMHRVIKSMEIPKHRGDIGELVVFEPPIHPPGKLQQLKVLGSLYRISYDPVSDKKTGQSLASIKVWKQVPDDIGYTEMRETIVATFKGRRPEPEAEHEIALALGIWYNCPVLYENQISGIYATFDKYACAHYLMNAPVALIKDVSPHSKVKESPGVAMSATLIVHSTRWLSTMMNSLVHRDTVGKKFTRIDLCYDLAFLYEMNFFGEGNFDDISSMRLMAIWDKFELNALLKAETHSGDNSEDYREMEEAADFIMEDFY